MRDCTHVFDQLEPQLEVETISWYHDVPKNNEECLLKAVANQLVWPLMLILTEISNFSVG